MPKLVCGLTQRKDEPLCGYRTASVSVEVELDAATLRDGAKLKQHIRCAFDRIREAIEEELAREGPSAAKPTRTNGNGLHAQRFNIGRRPR